MGVSDLDCTVRKSIQVQDGRRRLVMRPAVMTPLKPMMPAVTTIVIMIIAAVAIIAAAGIVALIGISVAVAAIAINRAVNSQIDANAAMSMAAAMISVMPLRHSWRARERDRGHDAQEKREFLDHATPHEPTKIGRASCRE